MRYPVFQLIGNQFSARPREARGSKRQGRDRFDGDSRPFEEGAGAGAAEAYGKVGDASGAREGFRIQPQPGNRVPDRDQGRSSESL